MGKHIPGVAKSPLRRRIVPTLFVMFTGALEVSLPCARCQLELARCYPSLSATAREVYTHQVTLWRWPFVQTVPACGYNTGGTNTSRFSKLAVGAPSASWTHDARSASASAAFTNIDAD